MTHGWLVTGGAGYIGSHVVRSFMAAGIEPVVIDDLSSGHRDFIPDGVEFIHGSLLNRSVVAHALTRAPAGVVHLAGYKYAGESMQRPLHTFEQNVQGTVVLLDEMVSAGVANIVFSSSAAVYGTPQDDEVTESAPLHPESPYGETKLIGEWLVADAGRAHGLRHTSLRYFNVAGSGSSDVYDSSPHNLFPMIFSALSRGETPHINGTDYDTPDGTCLRDYVHVVDVAEAHVRAAQALLTGVTLDPVYNLGSGTGFSVSEVMHTVARVTGVPFDPELRPRRLGDPARIVGSGARAEKDLGWTHLRDLEAMVTSAWAANPGRARNSDSPS
ncbi:MAG: UDP-glucose 4-epimerase GalE [Actinobacteria bacterium]|uniref:Unannotated protein n=1 Tax=freshwater metagenome TaxID=449393 RepID=A0A6J7F9I1_9ZZZZ|nr:UDP-glucose 4-epimerase GalE [Actinomycetota bacterium]